MSKEIITVKACADCPFLQSTIDYGEAFCGQDGTVNFYSSGGGCEPFPIGCPLCDGKVFVVCKFYDGIENDIRIKPIRRSRVERKRNRVKFIEWVWGLSVIC